MEGEGRVDPTRARCTYRSVWWQVADDTDAFWCVFITGLLQAIWWLNVVGNRLGSIIGGYCDIEVLIIGWCRGGQIDVDDSLTHVQYDMSDRQTGR